MRKTVNDMFKYSKANNIKLLSTYGADFWQPYITNYDKYDALFRRMFVSFKYFLQEDEADIEDVVTDFVNDVYNHLLANDKKYSELYRVLVLPDNKYSITDNYDVTETMDRDTTSNNVNDYGQRSDSNGNTSTGSVSPYDNNTFNNSTQVSDTGSFTKGSEHDTLDNTGTEDYTLHRVGNIGVMTITDMLKKHTDYWSDYEFYTYIFKDIARELLSV